MSVEKKMVMLADAPRVKYDKTKKSVNGDDKIVETVEIPKEGKLSDFFKG